MRTKLQSHRIVAGNRPLGPQVTSVDLFGGVRERFVMANIFVQSTSCNRKMNRQCFRPVSNDSFEIIFYNIVRATEGEGRGKRGIVRFYEIELVVNFISILNSLHYYVRLVHGFKLRQRINVPFENDRFIFSQAAVR